MARRRAKPKGKATARPKTARRRIRPLRWIGRLLLIAFAVPVLWVLAYRWIDPPGGYYMLTERLRLGTVARDWRDLSETSPHMARAAIAAEDAGFCAHWGFEIAAIEAALEANESGRRLIGGSTISQQVAKNVFLWHERSWTRKGLEAGFTLLIEAFWSKRRIVEVYLNVAEFAPGVFGVEAAARHHFGVGAAELSLAQASRLAAVLPAPQSRSASAPSEFVRRRARAIADGAATIAADGRADCVAADR